MANTPSLKASMRVRRSSPCLNRSSRCMPSSDAALSAESSLGFIAACKLPRHGRRHAENRDECTDLVQQRNAGQRHADGTIGNGSEQPHPNERERAVDGTPAPVEQAGNENKCGKDNEPDANKHKDVHVTSTPDDRLGFSSLPQYPRRRTWPWRRALQNDSVSLKDSTPGGSYLGATCADRWECHDHRRSRPAMAGHADLPKHG